MPLRVLHLLDSGGVYGPEVFLLHLIPEQVRAGMQPILGSIGEPEIAEKDIELEARRKCIRVETFRMRKGPDILGALRVIRFAQQENIHLIHCHGYKPNILMGLLPGYVRKIPYLVTMHGWTGIKRFSRLWLYAWLDVVLAKRANVAVAVAEAVRKHPRVSAVGLSPIVVHNGIEVLPADEEREDRSASLRDTFAPDGLTIGAVGRLAPEKGFDLLVGALARVIHRGYRASLFLIGDGPERGTLERIACQKGISNRVYFPGYLRDARKYLYACDVFVMSSRTEGLPITLLEAMDAGVPIVATAVGGIPEVLDNGRCGILVKPESEAELADGIISLVGSPEIKKRLCAAAKRRVVEEFSVEKMERGYREIYEILLIGGALRRSV